MKIIKYIVVALAVLMLIDSLGFAVWSMSGQKPLDGFYIGAITSNIINNND